MTTHFNYWLTGTGWAEAFFTSEKQNLRFEISYLTDPLTDLFEGLCRLIKNQSDTEKIFFADEPGEHSLVISKQDKDNIKIEIFWSNEWENMQIASEPQTPKELIYADSDTLRNFATAVCSGIDNLLERHTLAEYKEKWSLFEFPSEKYKELRELL